MKISESSLVSAMTMLVEEIVIDAFPPTGPGNGPILLCPECGKDFVRHTSEQSIMSKTDPNVS